MPRSNHSTDDAGFWADDRGSASLEFITAGLVLLVPLVYLVLAMSSIQAGALAVEGAARQASRVFVQSADVGAARASAIRAVEFALADHGVDPDSATITVSCAPDPSNCLTRRGFVTVTVTIAAPLPLTPPVIMGDFPIAVPLTATSTQHVSRFWSGG
jgi:Flp pilus assembly protein TadG